MVQGIGQMGIGQRRKLQPARGRVERLGGRFGRSVARGEFRRSCRPGRRRRGLLQLVENAKTLVELCAGLQRAEQ